VVLGHVVLQLEADIGGQARQVSPIFGPHIFCLTKQDPSRYGDIIKSMGTCELVKTDHFVVENAACIDCR
jgi:hypothetical protein